MAGAVDLRRADGTVHSWIKRGWLDEPADHDGTDQAPPGTPGMFRPNLTGVPTRIARKRVVVIETVLHTATAEDMLPLVLEMRAVWDPTVHSFDLVVADGYRGLAVGQTATLAVQFVNTVPQPQMTEFRRVYTWEVVSIANPPEWVLAP